MTDYWTFREVDFLSPWTHNPKTKTLTLYNEFESREFVHLGAHRVNYGVQQAEILDGNVVFSINHGDIKGLLTTLDTNEISQQEMDVLVQDSKIELNYALARKEGENE